jgi:parallel beta-helix repeat protein
MAVVGVAAVSAVLSAADAATFYVAPDGSDARTCADARNPRRPKRTLNNAVGCLTPGATLRVRAGLYEESLWDVIPSGSSWAQAVTVAAYPGETVTLRPRAGADRVLHFQNGHRFIVIDRLILDGVNVARETVKITYGSDPATAAHHIRLQNSEIKNAPGQGILTTGAAGHNEFINLSVHDNGRTDFEHGLYITNDDNLIDRCDVYRNAGWGLHLYSSPKRNLVRGNRVHDNARAGARGPGIGIYGDDNVVENNVVWNNNGGVELGGNARAQIYNNTIYRNNGGNGGHAGVDLGTSRQAVVANNIIFGHRENYHGSRLLGLSGTSLQRNLIDTDPMFVDASSFDLHLRPGSPAIDFGVRIDSVATDADGLTRPKGSSYDAGAYTSDSSPASRAK